MGAMARAAATLAALLGVSAYTSPPPNAFPSLDSTHVVEARKKFGGQITPLPQTKTRWHLADLERAEWAADTGLLADAALLLRSVRKDGLFAGVLSTRTDGIVRLPKKFRGDPEQVKALELGHDQIRSVFDEMFPAGELALLAGDGLMLGVGVGEFVPVEGRDYPVLTRLDPQWLIYRWNENRWYYQSIVGLLPITPGDGHWFLHTPGGRIAPWQNGLWRAIGRAWIDKEHARLMKSNWEGKLANPARVAVSPQGAGDEHKQSWFRAVMAWGVNTVFGVTPGYDVKLLESNGRGWECFLETIATSNRDIVIALTGSTVLVDGGTGFANADVHASIRADMIQSTADALAYTINTQGIPPWVVARWGVEALENCAVVSWDVTPPQDRNAEAQAMVASAAALSALTDALSKAGRAVDVDAFCAKFGVPVKAKPDGQPVQAAPTPAHANDNGDGSIDVDFSEAAAA